MVEIPLDEVNAGKMLSVPLIKGVDVAQEVLAGVNNHLGEEGPWILQRIAPVASRSLGEPKSARSKGCV